MKEAIDTLIIIPNDRLLQIVEKRTPVLKLSGWPMTSSGRGSGISDLITVPGLINLILPMRTIMYETGPALMGVGMGRVKPLSVEAARAAISGPLLETSIEGAREY